MTELYLRCLLLFIIIIIEGSVDCEECKNCYIGSTLQPSPCPDCCCLQDVPNTKNCCYKQSNSKDSKLDKDSAWQGLPAYFLGALASLVLVTILMTCCFRLFDLKCVYCRRRKPSSNRRRSSNEDDGPPAYDNIVMEDIHIVVPKSPPYVKDPPSYMEAMANPTDLPEVINDNG